MGRGPLVKPTLTVLSHVSGNRENLLARGNWSKSFIWITEKFILHKNDTQEALPTTRRKRTELTCRHKKGGVLCRRTLRGLV